MAEFVGKDFKSQKVWGNFKLRPWQYDLWQALALARKISSGRVHFKIRPKLHFGASPVASFTETQGNPAGTCDLKLNLTGLVGPQAPLPLWMTELMGRRSNKPLADFLDIFHDRLVNLYLELMLNLKSGSHHEAGEMGLDKYFLAAAGVLTECFWGRTMACSCSGPQVVEAGQLPVSSFLSAAPVWGVGSKSASGLEFLVQKVFEVPARIEPLKGAWLALPDEHRSQLGQSKHQLGVDTISGGQMFDPAAGFTLKLGPLTKEQYRSFLPPPAGSRRGDVLALVRWYAGSTLLCHLELLVMEEGTEES